MPYGSARSGYTSDGGFLSGVTQTGLLDTPKTIVFGAGGTSVSGGTTITADGVIEILKSDYYMFKQRFRVGRAGNSGISTVFIWAEISIDDGATWTVIGNSVTIKLNTKNETNVFFDISPLNLSVGVKLRNRFARSGLGDNSGDLLSATPSAALVTAGVPIAPSAQITIYKLD